MKIHIVQSDSTTSNEEITYYDIDVSKKDKVSNIKKKILNEKQHVVLEIIYDGRILDDSMTIEECQLQNGRTVYVKSLKTSRGGGAVSARIVLKTDSDDILIERKLLPTTTVEDLKRSIAGEVDASPEQINFVFNGKVMKNEAIVCDLGIRRREMLYYCLVLEPRVSSDGRKTGYILKPARN